MSREPTDEEYCAMMADHSIDDCINPETGWRSCSCGMFTEPYEGEPYDEYSAAYTSLKSRYFDELVRRFVSAQHSGEYASIQKAEAQVRYSTMLNGLPFPYLESLIMSLRNTPDDPDTVTEYLKDRSPKFDLAVALGVHLNSAEQRVLKYAMEADDQESRLEWGTPPELHEGNIELARTLATLIAGIEKLETSQRPGRYWIGDGLLALAPLLERRKDMVGVVAAIFNSRGISAASADHAIELLNDERTPAAALIDGVL